MSLIAEAMEQLQISSFLDCSDGEMYAQLFQKIEKLKNVMISNPTKNHALFDALWNDCLKELDQFDSALRHLKQGDQRRASCLHIGTIS